MNVDSGHMLAKIAADEMMRADRNVYKVVPVVACSEAKEALNGEDGCFVPVG